MFPRPLMNDDLRLSRNQSGEPSWETGREEEEEEEGVSSRQGCVAMTPDKPEAKGASLAE